MKITTQIIIILAALLSSSCDNNPLVSSEDSYLVFGHFFGECLGESCVEIFKIQNEQLYEDTLDYYPALNNLPHNTEYKRLSSEEYDKVKHIQHLIPEKLFEENTIVIGQPDAGDWGGFYIETALTGETRYWLIDKNKNNIPEYLYAFTDSLDATINRLQ